MGPARDLDPELAHRLYERHAEMCKIFSHAARLEILNALREGEMSVGELAEHVGLRLSNVSQHLAMMRDRGVLATSREGTTVYYRVANPRMLEAFDILREVLFEQIEADRTLIQSRGK
ncbi:MAG: helix-turn-helix transcriptional regulator [Solirubrobacterales bacterium]|nr:helix-turn-helix transcriptional regulator [Solirubrobacterales bacterium]